MKSLEQNKAAIIAIVIFIFAIIGYKYFFADTSGAVTTESDTAQTVGNQVLSLDQKLRSVTLDTSLLGSSMYLSLTDFTPVLPSHDQGRVDPFAPVGQ